MRNKKLCHKVLHSVLFILSFLSLWLLSTIGHQLVAATSPYKCIDKERNALVDFKAHLQDPNGLLSTWKLEKEEDNECCNWYGVMCNDQTGHVTELDLWNPLDQNGLEGKMSPSLLNLSYLTHFNLLGNSFNGTIPMFIGFMTQLRYLDLSYNSFSGTIPTSIGSLTELTHLHLSDNYLLNGSCIPRELGNLTNLKELWLDNLISCTIENIEWLSHMSEINRLVIDGTSLAKANNWVNVLASLQKLSYLSLWRCELSRVMHPYSSSFVNSSSSSIVTLDLHDNNLNSSAYHCLLPLTSNKLRTLSLSGNKLDAGVSFENICSLTSLDFSNNSVVLKFPDFLNNWSGCTSVTLQYLYASHSRFTGSLPDGIQIFSSLEAIDLDYNEINGSISEKVWELPKLRVINLSNNSLKGFLPKSHILNQSCVESIYLSSCNLGPRFPKWIQNIKNLTELNIADNRISDTISVEFWNSLSSRLIYLNLSSNNISGEVPDSIFDPNELSRIDLSSNNFYGSIPNVPSTLAYLDLSRNKFHGGISFLCHIADGNLGYLDLSHNSFTGKLPDCLWHFMELQVLNLGYNNLSGRLPAFVEYLIGLEVLCLYKNNFFGELPLSLKNCTMLTFLDLGHNMFTGNVPVWIGENLSRLYVLSLMSNELLGPIPLQLCQLANLQLLDLSKNNLYGTIPSCINNLTAMVQAGILHTEIISRPTISWNIYNGDYVDRVMINWQGNMLEFSKNLRFLNGLDLSSNNLSGQIPCELIVLHGLVSLNLSNNALVGKIPQKVGEMKNILALDLSRNNLSGGIPLSMSKMFSLAYLDVSYNRLSGRIPSSTQLQSFAPSRYTGNAGLCGLPLPKCIGDKDSKAPPLIGENGDFGKELDEDWRWFYIGGATGFVIAFWTVCSILLLSRYGHVCFHFLDSLQNIVYVTMRVVIAKLQ